MMRMLFVVDLLRITQIVILQLLTGFPCLLVKFLGHGKSWKMTLSLKVLEITSGGREKYLKSSPSKVAYSSSISWDYLVLYKCQIVTIIINY